VRPGGRSRPTARAPQLPKDLAGIGEDQEDGDGRPSEARTDRAARTLDRCSAARPDASDAART